MQTSVSIAMVVLLALQLAGGSSQARATSFDGTESLPPSTDITSSTTISESPPLLDDPMNSSATTSDENTDDPAAEDICVRCYDKVKLAQDMVDIYENLVRKQRKLVNRKKAAAEAAENGAATTTNAAPSRASLKVNKSINSTVSSRTLLQVAGQPEPIVVSRLRVARSPADENNHSNGWSQLTPSFRPLPLGKGKFSNVMNKKDLDLERLRREQERQKDSTCKALLELRDCLEVVARECIGNLHFHMYELFADQWYGKLRCPYPNNPKIKPLPGLRTMDLETTKTPLPRPISNAEEVRDRMHKILPDRQFPRPLGVMLKPTLSNTALKQLTPLGSDQQLTLQSQQSQMGPYQGLMRDFSGHRFGRTHNSNTARIVGIQQQQSPMSDDQTLNMVNIGKLLLVPCCFAIMVALVALASLRYRKVGDQEVTKY